jgi:hypothetical protein
MARMIDMIRNSQVPSNLMQAAARGALSVPPAETIEILVHLAVHNKIFGEQARITLAGWDESASLAAAADPKTHPEILEYYLAPENQRPVLLPYLVENPSVPEEKLVELAVSGSREAVEALLKSQRATHSVALLNGLRSNANLRPNEQSEVDALLRPLGVSRHAEEPGQQGDLLAHENANEAELDHAVNEYLKENAAELAAEKEKPYQAIADGPDGAEGQGATPKAIAEEAAKVAPAASTPATPAAPTPAAAARKKPGKEDERLSTLQKIAKLDVHGRIMLAMRGTKEERSVLVRDSTKLVAVAVLDSPKISDGEVEGIALQKNVLEAVLRAIPMKRRFAKNYCIMRNLVCNPRTPLDISLGLMKNLLVHDLKHLSGNKEVSETIRKLALRMFKQKTEKKKE